MAEGRRSLRTLPVVTAGLVACIACDWGRALDSDPEAWSPAVTVGESAPSGPDANGDAGAEVAIPEECNAEPPFDAALTQSVASAISHRPSEPCLEKCHEAGGTARSVFAVAGTVHRAQGQRAPVATGGTIHSVAGTTLTLDRCGNFYAVRSVLAVEPQLTQPFVQNPTLRRMEKPLVREQAAGSCNRATCHDFSSSSKSGIYY
jgi:hypothetical protein